MMICALCHTERRPDQMIEGKALCADRRRCQARAIANLGSATPAQAEALRLAGKHA